MQYSAIKTRVASNIGYVDSSGDILASKDITETDIGNWVNDRYRTDLFTVLATEYPEDFEVVATANFYKTSSTIDTISSTTLTISDANFNTGMVGDRVYNSTQGSYEEIASYTSTTVVTLDAAQSSWEAGDTVYVLGHEFAIGGDADDLVFIRRVGVKYDTSDEYYRTCHQRDENDLYKSGNESYSEVYPVWYQTSSLVSSVLTTTIGILPEPTENITNGIELRYVQLPGEMSSDSDVPRLPLNAHALLAKGATADALRKMFRFEEAMSWEAEYKMGKAEMLSNYAITRQQETPKMRPARRLRKLLDRSI